MNADDTSYVADIVQVDRALESWRDAGFDLAAAIGEPVDNSQEAAATIIKVDTFRHRKTKDVEAITFADNGHGIRPEILAKVLSLGFSTRYGARSGLGRFGVGLKLAALSVARRVDIYTRPIGDNNIYHTYLDLDEVAKGDQEHIKASKIDEFPTDFAHLLNGEDGPFQSGTLLVWSKVDRLRHQGAYGESIDEKLGELMAFLARAYRQFIDSGLTITLNGKRVLPQDPLFQLDNPLAQEKLGEDLKGDIIDQTTIEINGHPVDVQVSLCPREYRYREGDGGTVDKNKRDITFLRIPQNQGKISILRNGREIYYNLVPRMLPRGVDKIDRYIGIQVSFPAELDEYFQVRHVKRGAEPVKKLRKELREWLARPVKAARQRLRTEWGQVKQQERDLAKEHDQASTAVNKAEKTSPKGRAGLDLPEGELDQKISDLLEDAGADENQEKAEKLKEQIKQNPITLIDASWPGRELFEITHLNGKAILKLNRRHPFFREVYEPLAALADQSAKDLDAQHAVNVARRTQNAIDVLFMAYAKSENMHDTPEDRFMDLRSYWGQFTRAYVLELVKEG